MRSGVGRRLLLVPLEVPVRQRAAELIEFFLVVDELVAGVARDRVDVLEEDRLLGTNFLAQAAETAQLTGIDERASCAFYGLGNHCRRKSERRHPGVPEKVDPNDSN